VLKVSPLEPFGVKLAVDWKSVGPLFSQ